MKVCSFCGKDETEVEVMITSKNADICNICTLICMDKIIKYKSDYKEIVFEKIKR